MKTKKKNNSTQQASAATVRASQVSDQKKAPVKTSRPKTGKGLSNEGTITSYADENRDE